MTSIAIAGYVSSPIFIIKGVLLTTPSISGTVFTTPTPLAFLPNRGIGPNIPGHSNNHGIGSFTFATPLGTAFLLVCVVPTCDITTPYCKTCANSLSPPSLSSSLNNIGNTMIPTSASRSFIMMSASTSLFHGH